MTIQSVEHFAQLVSSDDPQLRRRAKLDGASEVVWCEIMAERQDLRRWIARNVTVPVRVLDLLSKDRDSSVRLQIAMCRRASEESLLRLAKDPDESVRLRVCRNQKTPRFVLEMLLHDSWAEISRVASERLAEFRGSAST